MLLKVNDLVFTKPVHYVLPPRGKTEISRLPGKVNVYLPNALMKIGQVSAHRLENYLLLFRGRYIFTPKMAFTERVKIDADRQCRQPTGKTRIVAILRKPVHQVGISQDHLNLEHRSRRHTRVGVARGQHKPRFYGRKNLSDKRLEPR